MLSGRTLLAQLSDFDGDPNDVTIATYQAAAQLYTDLSPTPPPVLLAFLDRLAKAVAGGAILELGSGPGREASYLESRGACVTRTDGTPAFVEAIRRAGFAARLLDIRTDDLGGPYRAVLANAVLLHISRAQCAEVLRRAHDAVEPAGLLALTVKEGDGAGWSETKLGLPRHFTYWREANLRRALLETGWTVTSLQHIAGALEPWIYLIAERNPMLPP